MLDTEEALSDASAEGFNDHANAGEPGVLAGRCKAFELVRQHRWPDSVRCSHCDGATIARDGHDDTQRRRPALKLQQALADPRHRLPHRLRNCLTDQVLVLMIQRFPDAKRAALHAHDLVSFLHVLQSLLMSPGVVRRLRLRPQLFDLGLLLRCQHRAVLL